MEGWIKENTGIILSVAVLLSALLMGVIPLRWDVVKRQSDGKFIRITIAGIFFIIFLVLALIFGVWKVIYDENNTRTNNKQMSLLLSNSKSSTKSFLDQKAANEEQKIAISDLRSMAKELIAENKDNRDRKNANRPAVEYTPVLTLCDLIFGNRQNPNSKGDTKNPNLLTINISICNKGNATASNLRDKIAIVNIGNTIKNYEMVPVSFTNKSEIIAPNDIGRIFSVSAIADPSTPSDVANFIYFKLDYTDLKNKKIEPLRKIFVISDGNVRETNSDAYETVMNYLISQKIW